MSERNAKKYWKQNIRYLLLLLILWFAVSFGFGILMAPNLNKFSIAGVKLGFWFAQQGSIYVFVIIIYLYVFLMNRLDRDYDVND